jgi:hypothetical protein
MIFSERHAWLNNFRRIIDDKRASASAIQKAFARIKGMLEAR